MASSKKNKLGKLKQAARNHLDETIGESPAAGERPQSDMRDFMESMPGREKQEKREKTQTASDRKSPSEKKRAESTGAGTPEAAPVSRPQSTPGANEDSDSTNGAPPAIPEETLVEVETDLATDAPAPDSAGNNAAATDNGPSADASEIELPNGGQTTAYAGRAAAQPERPGTMPKTRDSIYNVSSDIRLEDYTEGGGGSGGGGKMGTIAKIGGVIVLLALLGWGGQQLLLWLDAPVYRVTVANELIDDTNAAALANAPALVLSSSAPVHIRFDWEEGDLATDFLRIEILHAAGGQVEAAQERRPPLTANYVYFMGPLDPGNYRIRVLDRQSTLLVERDFRVN